MLDALERAKKAAGGATGLAAKLNELAPDRKLTPQAISQWKRVPAERAADVEKITGITCLELRPDVFRATTTAANASAA